MVNNWFLKSWLNKFLKSCANLLLYERRLPAFSFPAPDDSSECALFNYISISESKINLYVSEHGFSQNSLISCV